MTITFSKYPKVNRHTNYYPRRLIRIRHNSHTEPVWESVGRMQGDLEGGLPYIGGDWHVSLESSPAELQGWLERYAAEQPKEAVSLLAKALQIAASKLEGEQSVEKEK